jgi:hypothetical protein
MIASADGAAIWFPIKRLGNVYSTLERVSKWIKTEHFETPARHFETVCACVFLSHRLAIYLRNSRRGFCGTAYGFDERGNFSGTR